jgi:hypothetical protein
LGIDFIEFNNQCREIKMKWNCEGLPIYFLIIFNLKAFDIFQKYRGINADCKYIKTFKNGWAGFFNARGKHVINKNQSILKY